MRGGREREDEDARDLFVEAMHWPNAGIKLRLEDAPDTGPRVKRAHATGHGQPARRLVHDDEVLVSEEDVEGRHAPAYLDQAPDLLQGTPIRWR